MKKSLLYIDDIVIMNVGDLEAREKILQEGVAIVLHPYDDDGRSVLNNLGQRAGSAARYFYAGWQ